MAEGDSMFQVLTHEYTKYARKINVTSGILATDIKNSVT